MKARGFFLLLLLFTGSCFAWWIIQLDRLNQHSLMQQEELAYLRVEKAQNQLIWLAGSDSNAEESNSFHIGSLRLYISPALWDSTLNHYPDLEFSQEAGFIKIQPKASFLGSIRQKSREISLRQIIESTLFFSLLFIGFIWIYRGLVQAIDLSKQQSNFLVSVTHELKTPIASSRLLFETIFRHKLDYEKLKELSSAGITNSVQQLGLVESLLIASRLENHSSEISLQRVILSDWLENVLEALQQDYGSSLKLECHIQSGIEAQIDDMSLRLSIANLLSNAHKYGGEEGTIFVRLQQQDAQVIVQIGDEGPGIPDGAKRTVFKKFYRGGEPFTQVHHGSGLGLFIVSETAKRHKGKAWVEDREPQGSMFNLMIKTL